MRKLFIIQVLFIFCFNAHAQWSSVIDGDYSNPASWDSQPPSDGLLAYSLTVNDSIYRNGSIGTIKTNGKDGSTGFVVVNAGGDLVVSTNVVIGEGTLTIKNNGVVEVFGDLEDGGIVYVLSGGTLIVHGNVNLTNTQTTLSGDVIVLGNVTLKNTDMIGSANLVVGGKLASDGGNLNNISGDVYLLDPDANDPPAFDLPDTNPPKYIEDLIEDEAGSGLIDDITDIAGSVSYVWDGSSSTVWTDIANWSDSKIPGPLDVVVIGNVTNRPVIPVDLSIRNLSLDPSAQLTIPVGSKVTIFGDITIGAGANLIVENSVAKPTSFLHYGQVNGNITYKWSYNSGNWWLIGHAISNPTMANYDAILAGGNDYAMYDYQDLSVMQKISKTAFDFSAQDEIRGYLLKVKNNAIISHTGLLNSGDVYPKTLQTGWQVIANPYASYYQLPTEASSGADFEHTTGSVYVTVSTSNSDKVYHTFNTITGVGTPAISGGTFNGIIAPTQAFYVETTGGSEGQNVYMRSVHRVHDAAKAALKSGQVSKEQDILRIKLENDNAVDEAVILLREDGEIGLTRMDSKQRFVTGNSLSYIYSLVEDDKAVINVLPNAIEEHQVNLGVKAQAGGHTLKITGLESLTDAYELVLEDKLTESFCEMTTDTEYAFTTAEGDFDDRFVLHFKKAQVPTTIETPEKDKDQQGVKVYIEKRNELFVECDWDINEKNISIYNLAGQLVLSTEFLDKNYKDILNVKTGIYVVKITGEYQSYRQQVFVQ